ncbi:MAG: hypothetical protein QXT05_02540 [Candidatus Bilamarchaeaceae archaeon]
MDSECMPLKEVRKTEEEEVTAAFGYKTINWITKEMLGKLYSQLSNEERKYIQESLKRIKSEFELGKLMAKNPIEKAIATYLNRDEEGKLVMRTKDVPSYRKKLNELMAEHALGLFDVKTREFLSNLYFGETYSKLSENKLNELGLKLYGVLNAAGPGYGSTAEEKKTLSMFIKKDETTGLYTIPAADQQTLKEWVAAMATKKLKAVPKKV